MKLVNIIVYCFISLPITISLGIDWVFISPSYILLLYCLLMPLRSLRYGYYTTTTSFVKVLSTAIWQVIHRFRLSVKSWLLYHSWHRLWSLAENMSDHKLYFHLSVKSRQHKSFQICPLHELSFLSPERKPREKQIWRASTWNHNKKKRVQKKTTCSHRKTLAKKHCCKQPKSKIIYIYIYPDCKRVTHNRAE